MRIVLPRLDERGISVVENLIAIALLAMVVAGSAQFVMLTMQANQSTRSYSALAAEAQKMIDGYRASYPALLNKFGSAYSAITNGQTAIEESSSSSGWTDFRTTFTAIKTSNVSFPEAVQVEIVATQRRGRFAGVTHTFGTWIARVR